MSDTAPPPGLDAELEADMRLLGAILDDTLRAQEGSEALARIEALRRMAEALRAGQLAGGRDAFAARVAALDTDGLELVARAMTEFFHLVNVAEEQQRIRMLRRRDRPGEPPPEGSLAAATHALARGGMSPAEVREVLGRLLVMPVLTAHPTEARRRTLLDHLAEVSAALDHLDDGRLGARERAGTLALLREAVLALYTTEEARTVRPSPIDEVRAGLLVFQRTLLEVTPAIYRRLEEALAEAYPGEAFEVGTFLRWGTWIGGDRDGNPHVTAEVTRTALERHRALALAHHLADVEALGRELSVSARRVRVGTRHFALEASLEEDRARLPAVAARVHRYTALEPWREKLWYMRARLEAARGREELGYADAHGYLEDLRLLERSLEACGLGALARGRLRDVRRRAECFGFHLATLDLRQHAAVHEAAVAELLARGGVPGYGSLDEAARVRRLAELLERADVGAPRDRSALSPEVRELLATLDVVGRARRDLGPEACERYIVSFTSSPSDLLEVLFLIRAARLGPDELRPVPLLEQLTDLERAPDIARAMLDLRPIARALGGELEVMIGYSDSSKQSGYVASQAALVRAQEGLGQVAGERNVILTVFHGRGGAIGRGGGPANLAIRAQPPQALRGRLRVTEQGETIAARYGRREIAQRDLEQMVNAVLVASLAERAPVSAVEHQARDAALARAARAAQDAYDALLGDRDRLVRYALAATPIQEIAELPIASRPASRQPGLRLEELRAIPWVFSWNQSRHGLPGWFGLGAALTAVAEADGLEALRALYRSWPFFHALVDNARLALARADIEVAAHYARLADEDAQAIFALVAAEHERTVGMVRAVVGAGEERAASSPAVARSVGRRNPAVDVLSHVQIELLRRLRHATAAERERIREILFITINGIAAGLQTAG